MLNFSSDSSTSSLDDSEEEIEDIQDSGLSVSKEYLENNLSSLGVAIDSDPSTLLLHDLRHKHPNAFRGASKKFFVLSIYFQS